MMLCFVQRSLLTSCALVTMLCRAASAQAPALPPGTTLTLEDAVARALSANPTVRAARLRRAIDLAGVGVARERPNPDAHVEIERETPHQAVGMAFPLETGGKRARRIALGEAALRTADAELALVVVDIRASVRRAYFTRQIADARLLLHDELVALAVRVRDAAQTRFDSGSAPRLEVLQAQLALADAENQRTAAEGQAVAARAQFNALLDLPLDGVIPLATSLDVVPATFATEAIARARSGSTELAIIDRRLEEQRARIGLARALQIPDVIPETTITHGNAPEFNIGWRVAVGVTVPLFSRRRAGVVLEEATLTQLAAEREATLARITVDVTSAAALADAQRRQFLRYRDEIVPQALEIERLADDSYRLGQTGLAAYLQALEGTRDARLRSLQAASDFQAALADLERTMGVPLP